eukprot:1137427-Pelagomonas_calceolata.AAC.2
MACLLRNSSPSLPCWEPQGSHPAIQLVVLSKWPTAAQLFPIPPVLEAPVPSSLPSPQQRSSAPHPHFNQLLLLHTHPGSYDPTRGIAIGAHRGSDEHHVDVEGVMGTLLYTGHCTGSEGVHRAPKGTTGAHQGPEGQHSAFEGRSEGCGGCEQTCGHLYLITAINFLVLSNANFHSVTAAVQFYSMGLANKTFSGLPEFSGCLVRRCGPRPHSISRSCAPDTGLNEPTPVTGESFVEGKAGNAQTSILLARPTPSMLA